MKRFESPLYGNIPEPETINELLDLATSPIEGEVRNVYMWRGQCDIGWTIDSGAFRRLKRTREAVTEAVLARYEEDLLRRATHQGLRLHEGRTLSDFELLARLQHHGAATRLLDATRSIVVGLYFAAESRPDQRGLLAGFHCSFLGGGEGSPEDRRYEQVVEGLENYEHPQTWDAPLITPRIAAQHSQFLYSAVGNDVRGSLRISASPNSFLPISISPEFKAKSLTVLSEQFDIRHSTLFPDIHGFCYLNSTRFGQFDNDRW